MATPVEMPKLGNTVEDCLLVAWQKHEGDRVVAGDVIAEIETDKTSFDLTAPVDGVLLGTFFDEGALVPVFTVIGVIGSAGENVDGFRPQTAGAPAEVVPSLPSVDSTTSLAPRQPPTSTPGDARLSPRARRFAREHSLDVGLAAGTGPGGRVLEADLVRLYHSREQRAGAEDRYTIGLAEPAAGKAAGAEAGGVRMPPVRERIARRLRESLSQTAQYTLNTSANAAGLLVVRKKMKASALTAEVTIGDIVAFCTVRALLEVPGLNAELLDGVVYRHSEVNLGFACDTERGLVVPVVHHSEGLSLLGLSKRIKDLAAQANQASIAVEDLNGATFTLSNLGSLGVESFTPVLNPPQVALLGVNAIQVKAVRKPDGNIEFIDAIGLSLTLDHQVVDGAPGARFLQVLRDKIERAELLCTT